MQKPTFSKPSTFIYAVTAMLLAGTIFLSPARGQDSTSPAQQAPASSATPDSSAALTPAKPAAKMTPEAKHLPTSSSKAKPSATAPATKPNATMGSQANDAGKPSSSASAPAASSKQAGATKTGQAGATKTTKAGASKTATAKTAAALTLNTPKDKQSYAIGINIAKGLNQNLKQSGLEIDPAILTRAIKDVLSGSTQSMTDQEAQDTLKTLQTDLRKAQELKQQQAFETNKKEGDQFLAANKAKEGVVTLPDGLQYKILQEGTGPRPAASDAVTVNYRGTLVNGSEFDSSYKRNQPFTTQVAGGIIKGWTEALELMPVGSKWQLFIPSDLAYGPSGRPPVIGPNSTLVFEVELVSIQPKSAAPAAPVPNPAPAATPNAPAGNPAPTANQPAPAPKPAPPTPKSDAPAPTPKPPTP